MIVEAYGIPWLSVLELSHLLSQLGCAYGIVNRQGLVKQNADQQVLAVTPVVFASGTLLCTTQKRFKSRVLALVVDQETVLQRELGLELVPNTNLTLQTLRVLVRKAQTHRDEKLICRQAYSPVAEVLSKFKQSCMSQLQTAIHKAKRVDPEIEVGRLVYKWLRSEMSAERVRSKLQRLGPRGEEICVLMTTREVKRLKLAVNIIQAKGEAKIDVVARTHGVTPFDIRFVMKATK